MAVLEREAGHPHAAAREADAIEALCQSWRNGRYEMWKGFEQTRAQAVCALNGAERVAHANPFLNYRTGKKLVADIQAYQLGDFEEAERLHVTGRLRSALSPAFGQDLKTSLYSWRVMERMHPSAPGTDYWTAVSLERQGNREAADELFEKARAASDPKALARDPGAADADFGWSPVLFSSPARGTGLALRAWDDRLGDRKRSIVVLGRISTRPLFGAFFSYTESEWTAPLSISVQGSLTDRVRDWFGSSMTASAAAQVFRATESTAAVLVSTRWMRFGRVALGGRAYEFQSVVPAGVSAPAAQTVSAEIAWDTRDRPHVSRAGMLFRIQQDLGWAGAVTFARTAAQFQWNWRWGVRQGMQWNAVGGASSGAIPHYLLYDLFDSQVPVVREFRYMDSQSASAWARYYYQFYPWLRVGGFLTTAGAFSDWNQATSALRFGAGIDAELLLSRTANTGPRWEFGIFNGEWIFQGGMRVGL